MTAKSLTGKGLCAALALACASSAAAVSYRQERELGRRFDMAAHQELPLLSDPEIVSYVDGIGQKIVANLKDSPYVYRFAVVRDGHINAFAVPGGYVYVNHGLLTNAANDDEIAAVLGHEIAHVHAHHIARQQEKTQLMNYATLLAMLVAVAQPAIAPLATAANQAVTLKYRREFEQEADYRGIRYLEGTGYDPRAMLDFFKKLADQSRTMPGLAPPYLLAHPLTDERLNHLEAVLRAQQWGKHERKPPTFTLLRVQALARARSGPAQDVLKAYRRGVEENPGDPVARYLLGVVALETGQLDEAAQALEAAREAGLVAADRELGRLALRQRNLGEAVVLLSRHIERDPTDAAARAELAKAFEAGGKAEQAMAAYKRAFELAPQMASAHYGYGILTGRAGNQGEGFYHLALAARLSGDYEGALAKFVRAEPLLPARDPRSEVTDTEIEELSGFLRVSVPNRQEGEGEPEDLKEQGEPGGEEEPVEPGGVGEQGEPKGLGEKSGGGAGGAG